MFFFCGVVSRIWRWAQVTVMFYLKGIPLGSLVSSYPSKNMPTGVLGALICPLVRHCVLWWIDVPSRLYSCFPCSAPGIGSRSSVTRMKQLLKMNKWLPCKQNWDLSFFIYLKGLKWFPCTSIFCEEPLNPLRFLTHPHLCSLRLKPCNTLLYITQDWCKMFAICSIWHCFSWVNMASRYKLFLLSTHICMHKLLRHDTQGL